VTVVMPGPPGPSGPPPAQGPVHEPEPTAPADPRFPWKSKGTRKPLSFWDRSKFLILFAVIFTVLVWYDLQRFSPPATFGEITGTVAWDQQWLVWLAGLEILRQLHYLISEHSREYHQFWTQRVFGRTTRSYERRFNAWNRYRISRVVKWIFLIVVLAVVLGKFTNSTPVVALFKVPALVVQALPTILQVLLLMLLAVGQFVAIFWFMSKGGVETYFPDDIDTRFTDVWGQDHVLERIKENIVLLEKPEAIEEKGGHVPSGILLYGPPGTGKTLMAEAVAGETGKPYVFVDPGAFTAMFFGVGILKVKSLFRRLRKLALRYGGVIVFFDEADTLGSRGNRAGGPQPVGTATPAPIWGNHACGGPGLLSQQTRWDILRHTMAESADEPTGRPRRFPFVAGAGMGGGSSGFDGTLQALLTELSGLKKPRGFINRVIRRTLGMRPKPPPKYRILVMMASNLPEALDPALLRPGRIDRIYRVGYPSKAGRVRTYQGYFDKTTHNLSQTQIEKLAVITPYATGAEMKDLVNEALIYAIRENRDLITWQDVIKAKHLKALGPPEDVEYIERERHAVAVHEACHAVAAWATRRHMEIDLATIEKGSGYLGMVASIPPEDQYTQWRSEYESDIIVSLASLAGERLFFHGDNSSGVSGDLKSATVVAALMESHWGMGSGISSLPALQDLQIGGGMPEERKGKGGGTGFGDEPRVKRGDAGGPLGQRIEANLVRLLEDAEHLLEENRSHVLALAHALENHKTLSGEDVIAVLECKRGELIDGRPYADPGFIAELEQYHERAMEAHQRHAALRSPMPLPPGTVLGQVVDEAPSLVAAATGAPVGAGYHPQASGPNGGAAGQPGWTSGPAPTGYPQQPYPNGQAQQPYPNGHQTYPYPQQAYPTQPYPAPYPASGSYPQQPYPASGAYPQPYPPQSWPQQQPPAQQPPPQQPPAQPTGPEAPAAEGPVAPENQAVDQEPAPQQEPERPSANGQGPDEEQATSKLPPPD
jgi:ATP-dependent Zn protease